MTTLLTNIKGEMAVKAMINVQAENLIFIHTSEGEETELDKIYPVEYNLVRMDNIINCMEDLAATLKRVEDNLYVALDGGMENLSTITFFLSNAMNITGVFLSFNGELVGIPLFPLRLSETKKQAINLLNKESLKATDLAIKLGISLGMTYQHLRHFLAHSLVYVDDRTGRYTLTDEGRIIQIIIR